MKTAVWLTGLAGLFSFTCLVSSAPAAEPKADRPNIIIILADDLGYSDIAPYGGEIRTPNLDRLASEGIRFRHFYNTARCCPTRASLLTGLAPHEAGIGHMTAEDEEQSYDYGYSSYRGVLSPESVTLAEVLKEAGYRTLMSGKWHVGTHLGTWPRNRGFDRFYGIIRGAANYYQPRPGKLLTLDDHPVKPEGEDFYMTDAIADHAIEFVEESVTDDPERPFFLYLAFTAPHWPIQVPEAYSAPYEELYVAGWNRLREERLRRQIEIGAIPAGTEIPPMTAPDWDSLPDKRREDLVKRMSIYAGMVTNMDENIGRVLDALEELGERENTVVFFLSDNGACAEGGEFGSSNGHLLGTEEGYFLTVGGAWANYSNTPLREYKHYTHEGGMATPMIVSWPRRITENGGWTDGVGQIADFMPTVLELAGSDYPEVYDGRRIKPHSGRSLLPILQDQTTAERRMYFEHEGNRSAFKGHWKLVSKYPGDWELFNLVEDRAEARNLASVHPDLVAELSEAWNAWADRAGVLPWPATRREGYAPPERVRPNTWKDLEE